MDLVFPWDEWEGNCRILSRDMIYLESQLWRKSVSRKGQLSILRGRHASAAGAGER